MSNLKLIDRDVCCITGTDDMESLIKLPAFPIYSGCTDDCIQDDMSADMEWGISKRSGLIQLMHLVPEKVLYAHGHGSGSVGVTWQRHHKAFAEFIRYYSPKRIFEIGGHMDCLQSTMGRQILGLS